MEKNTGKHLQKLHFTIEINAPKEKVWDTMLNDETYRQWASAFCEGSHYVGSWEKESKIQFLDPKGDGMLSKIMENRPYEFISIENLGFVQEGNEDTESEGAKAMAGTLENYTFRETEGVTEVFVEMDSDEKYAEMFEDTWPKALEKLKGLSEGN